MRSGKIQKKVSRDPWQEWLNKNGSRRALQCIGNCTIYGMVVPNQIWPCESYYFWWNRPIVYPEVRNMSVSILLSKKNDLLTRSHKPNELDIMRIS